MLINRLTQSVVTFILAAAIARLLGAYELGQYLLAFSYYFIFVSLASQGLKVLFTRELARNPGNTSSYFINGIFLQLFISTCAFVFLIIFILVMPYGEDTSRICLIMGIAIIPFALSNVTESVFQAQEQMFLIAATTVPVYILRLIFMLVGLNYGLGVGYVAAVFVVSESFIFLIQFILCVYLINPEWRLRFGFIRSTVKDSLTFFAIEGIAVISSRLEIIILSVLASEQLLGFYGAVTQLLMPFLIVANSILLAIFPVMSKTAEQRKAEQRRMTEFVIEILLFISLPFLMGILFLGQDVLVLIYGANFAQATTALQIAGLTLVIRPFNRALSYLLVANGFERVNLRQVTISLPIKGILGFFLISQFQLLGAAALEILMAMISGSQYIYATYNRLFTLHIWRVFSRPLLVSSLMIPILWGLKQSHLDILLMLLLATVSYVIMVGTIGIFLLGGPRILYTRFSK